MVSESAPGIFKGKLSGEADSRLELWGGVECTVNRVHEKYLDQLRQNGHNQRLSDLDRFAELGIKAIRQPVLWECVAPDDDLPGDWTWSDVALARLQELGIRPIVGLLHHGSGPRHTNLLDPQFPEKLAHYAARVAKRYPWVRDYTPVNEPLTTARFSALYGHWYPHACDDASFARALINQCRAVVLAMAAVRKVNSQARLVQTDDLGKIFSTPALEYQADFENERRWITYDLLVGRVCSDHPMWPFLTKAGIAPAELEWFTKNACPPGVIGVNHYLSGERFLDENLNRYPPDTHGGNSCHRYADVLASRVRPEGAAGPAALLMEAWQRYGVPIAITECHNGCTREEQLRWFAEMWNAAESARSRGADVLALTVWSLLGAFDWNTLVTQENGCYEPGVFDVRSSPPRPTALAKLARKLSHGEDFKSPLLSVPGWWKRPERFVYGFSINEQGVKRPAPASDESWENVRPLLITGGTGTLGRAFARICELRGIPYRLLKRGELDIADPHSVRQALFRHHPWAVINAAGYVRVDEAEADSARCYRENVAGPTLLATECRDRGIPFVTFSSDLVFDGRKETAYVESDPVRPLNQYGYTKAEAERRVLEILPEALVIRTSAFFGAWDEYNFVISALRAIAAEQQFEAAGDAVVSPTYVPDLVNHTLDLLIDEESGIWHLANVGETTWADLAERAAELADLGGSFVRRVSLEEMPFTARRPVYCALSSERGIIMPTLESALNRYIAEVEFTWQPEVLAA